MASLHGPLTVSSNLQVRLPVKLARQLRIEGGDEVYLRINDEDPGTLSLLPVEVVERRYSQGERAEKRPQREGADVAPVAVEPPQAARRGPQRGQVQ